MDDVTKRVSRPISRDRPAAKAAPADRATAEGTLSPGAIDALADIAKRIDRLGRLHAERIRTSDDYQVIDPRTVAATLQEFTQTAKPDPARLVEEQFRLWADMGLLWQRTAARFLFNTPVEPVISPSPQDKRFRSELWADNYLYDYVKQSYLLMSRYLQACVDSADGVDPHTHHKQKFYTRQLVNALSPTNFVATNPVVLKAALEIPRRQPDQRAQEPDRRSRAWRRSTEPEDERRFGFPVWREHCDFIREGRFSE